MSNIDVMDIKSRNVNAIFNLIRFEDGLTARMIAERTGLSFATVSNMCNELNDKGILYKEKDNTPSIGRTPYSMYLNYQRYYSICLNLQLKNVMNFAVLDIRNNCVFERQYDISHKKTPEDIIYYARDIFEEEIIKKFSEDTIFIGVGVAVSSVFDKDSRKLINCAIDMFEGVMLKDIVEEIFQMPAYIDNESNLCALSVQTTADNYSNIVYLHSSEGVGVGIVAEGNLIRGKNGYGAEVSHIPVGNPKIKCPTCKGYGCVENELSVKGIVRQYFNDEDNKNGLDVLKNWEIFLQSLEKEEIKAMKMVNEIGKTIGVLSTILINIFDPEVFYIGGNISVLQDYIMEPFINEIKTKSPMAYDKKLPIIFDKNSDMTINIGINEVICRNWDILG